MMRLTHFEALHTNKPSSLQSTAFDKKEYLNTRDKIRKNLSSLTTNKSYERIKNTRTGSNSTLPIEFDDVPESCVPLYASPIQRGLFSELARYADHPKMTVKDILVPFSHSLLMEQKYTSSDLILDKLSRPIKMRFIVDFLLKVEQSSRKTYQINIICNDYSMEYILYETVKCLNLDCQRFRDHHNGKDDQHVYGVVVQSKDPDRINSRPHINLLIVYDCAIPPDLKTQQTFMNTPSTPLFILYLTLINTPEIRLFNYLNLNPTEDVTWCTPIANLSVDAKKCLLSDFEYTAVDSDREWNHYMSQKAYKWALIDQRTPFRETRTRPNSFISEDQYQIRPKHRYPSTGNDVNDTSPEIMDILTQVLYHSFDSSESSGRGSPIPSGPKHMSSPRNYDGRGSSINISESSNSALHHPSISRKSKGDEGISMDIDEDEYTIGVSPSPSVSSTSFSVHEESSLNRRNVASKSQSLEKSIHNKNYKRPASLEREEIAKKRKLPGLGNQNKAPHESKGKNEGDSRQFIKSPLMSIIPESTYTHPASSSTLKRPQAGAFDENDPARSPKMRRLTSPQPSPPPPPLLNATAVTKPDNKKLVSSSFLSIRDTGDDRATFFSSSSGYNRDLRMTSNRDPRLSLSPTADMRNAISPPPVKHTMSHSRDPRRQASHASSSSSKSRDASSNKPTVAQKPNLLEGDEKLDNASRFVNTTPQHLTAGEEDTKKKAEEEKAKKEIQGNRKMQMYEQTRMRVENARKKIQETVRLKEEEKRKKIAVLRKQSEEEKIQKQMEEALRKKAEEEKIQKQMEEALRKKTEEEKIQKQKEEALRKKAEEDKIQKQKEEALRKKAEEEKIQKQKEEDLRKKAEEEKIQKQKEEEARKQKKEEVRKQKEEELRKKMEEKIIKQKKEEEARKQREEEIEQEIRNQKEDEIRKRIEEEVRKKILDEMRKEEEDKKRAKQEEEKKKKADEENKAQQKENEKPDTLSTNDTMSDFEKALEKIHLEFQAALRE